MIRFEGRLLLFDIEGTVSPLAFVREVMFPHARKALRGFLDHQAGRPDVVDVLGQMARDAGRDSVKNWCPHPIGSAAAKEWLIREIEQLMEGDAKLTGFKQLQGLIWEEGFRSGALQATLFPDVVPAWQKFLSSGLLLQIYSSGSVQAQRLFFAHTQEGDLTPMLSDHHDTTRGSKKEAASYATIASAVGMAPGEILFVSDIVAELDAAREAGFATALAVRPGNPEADPSSHAILSTLEEIILPA